MIDCGPILELVEVEHEVEYRHLTVNHVKTLNLHLSAVHACNQIIQVGSVNGLICVCHRYDATYIFNPVVEEYVILPAEPRLKLLLLSYGFGVSMEGEYKVVRMSGRRISLNPSVHAVEIDVYTLGTDQWRSLGQTPYHLYNSRGKVGSGVFVNGHVYWIADGQIYDFDLTTETFELFPSPPPGDNRRSKQMLGVLKGSLSHFSWCWLGLEVWVMKEESWYKAIAIPENINYFLKLKVWTPLCLVDGSKSTSILIFATIVRTEKLVACYCLDTNMILHLNLPAHYSVSTVMTYHPSLLKLQNFGSERVRSLYNASDTICIGPGGSSSNIGRGVNCIS